MAAARVELEEVQGLRFARAADLLQEKLEASLGLRARLVYPVLPRPFHKALEVSYWCSINLNH